MVITARAWSGASQSTTGPLGTYATFWPQGKRRYRMLAPPRIGASGLGIVRSSARWAVQPNADFSCAQRAVCRMWPLGWAATKSSHTASAS